MSELREKCGVVGIFGAPEAAWLTYLGLYALQHRGQEGAGICTSDSQRLHVHRGRGLIAEVFSKDVLASLPGTSAIGHNRYSTTGSDETANLQPLIASYRGGVVAIAHNGNLVNAKELREECEHLGSIFQTTVDSEVIVHLLARARPEDLVGRLRQALSRVRGAYSSWPSRPTRSSASAIRTDSALCASDAWKAPGSSRRRAAPWTSSARSTCAKWTPARSW